MKRKIVQVASKLLLFFSAFSIVMVSAMAFNNPQSVMDLVGVQLPNTDAYSSIRGVYGGVGVTIFATLVYLAVKDTKKGLVFAAILWGSYALSRLMTIAVEGSLGAFGNQWLVIESVLCVASVIMLVLLGRSHKSGHASIA